MYNTMPTTPLSPVHKKKKLNIEAHVENQTVLPTPYLLARCLSRVFSYRALGPAYFSPLRSLDALDIDAVSAASSLKCTRTSIVLMMPL